MDSMRVFKHQRGYGFAAVFFLILITVTTGVVGWSTYLARQATNELAGTQRTYLEKVAASIESAYQNPQFNAFELVADASQQTTQADKVRTALLPVLNGSADQKWDTQIEVSDLLIVASRTRVDVDSFTRVVNPVLEVPGRVIVVWLRRFGSAGPNTSTFDRSTGVFTPVPANTPFIIINTTNSNSAAYYKTKTQLNHLANAYQAYYRARAKLSGMQYKDVNYFRPTPCTPLPANDLPCIDSYTAASAAVFASIGLDASAGFDGWGNPIEVSNLAGSNIDFAVGPFTMSLRATTPWGATIVQTVDAPN